MTAETVRRVALITGCGRDDGLGAAVARKLASSGVAVVVTDIAATPALQQHEPADGFASGGWRGLASLEAELRQAGCEVASATGDVSNEEAAAELVRAAVDSFGRLDVLVNNAAASHGAELAPLDEVPVSGWDRVIGVNLRGTFLMCRAALPVMRANSYGRIVNIGSIAAHLGMPRLAAYSAAKAGIVGLTRSLAAEAGRFGVTVNAVCPGRMSTSRSMTSGKAAGLDAQAELERRRSLIPVGRIGLSGDVAAVVAFFASEEAGYVTGQSLSVDGGESIT